MKSPLNLSNDRRFWAGVYVFAGLTLLIQLLGIAFYERIIAGRIDDRIVRFEKEAKASFSRGDFDLKGFSDAAFLYENGILRRWNNSEFIPPSVFLSESSNLSYLEVAKKYMVLYRLDHEQDGKKIELVLLLPLFQESPRGNPIIEDLVNKDLFVLGGIGPDSFEGDSRGVDIRGETIFRFTLDYENLQLPLWIKILDSLFFLLVWMGIRKQVLSKIQGTKRQILDLGLDLAFFSVIFFLWLGISRDLFLPALMITFSGYILRRSDQKLPKIHSNSRLLALAVIISVLCVWVIENWIEVNPSSYLGLNIGWERAALANFLVLSSTLFFWILFLSFLMGFETSSRRSYLVAAIFLGLSVLAALFIEQQVWLWFMPPALVFVLKGYRSDLSPKTAFFVLALLFAGVDSQITREVSLSQRLSQFESIINSINRPEDSQIKEDLERLELNLTRDPLILTSFKRSIGSFKTAERKIKNHHLKSFKQFYDIDILFFDHQDRNLQPGKSTLDLGFYQNKLFRDKSGMVAPNLRVINNSIGNVQEFSVLTEFKVSGKKMGTVLVLGERREGIGSGVGKVVNSLEGLSFNYSYWPYSSFKISRDKGLIWDDWVESEALKSELADSISSHFDMMGSLSFDKEGLFLRAVVFDDTGFGLAFPFPGLLSFLGNFLVMLTFFLILSLVLYLLDVIYVDRIRIGWNLRTKMQFLYLFAIILPLGIFSFLLFWTQSNSFEENLRAKDMLKAKNYFDQTREKFAEFLNGQVSRSEFVQYTRDQAEEKGLNISVYDQSGTMFYTDFPTLYKSHIFSPLIDPDIYFDKMGVELNYKKVRRAKVVFGTIIFPLAASNGEPYYYLFVPFFDNYKKVERERERLGVITLGLFGLFAGLFILLAFFLTKRWLHPLDVLSGQLKGIRLTEDPKPIEWKQEDEIGEVVGAYNMMISKLIESREALSISKQDEAWKEMAKQVAHEIKNPLTPMRLRIQQVLSNLSGDKDKNKDLIRYLEDAIRNIDLVDETAKSFQGFASLPVPKNKDLDLGDLLKQVISPFSAHPQAMIRFELSGSEYPFFGDSKILGGAFLNLVLNGLQSVPEGRRPQLKVSILKENSHYTVCFEDNGIGVNEELKEKIFEPHYTTKKSGSGLGLQIVKRSVDVYKGKVLVEDSVLGGACFKIVLPENG